MGNIAEQRPSSAETHQTLHAAWQLFHNEFVLVTTGVIRDSVLVASDQKCNNYFVKILSSDYVRQSVFL